MPRPMLRTPQQNKTEAHNILSAVNNQVKNQHQINQIDKIKLDKILRKKRSKEYMDAMKSLDAGGHVQNQQQIDSIIDTIKKEFPEVELSEIVLPDVLLGYVSICYLGKPYEVHTLSISGRIIQHYKSGESLPDGLEKARNIAMRGGYSFIEVYSDCCRAVSSNGTVSVIIC